MRKCPSRIRPRSLQRQRTTTNWNHKPARRTRAGFLLYYIYRCRKKSAPVLFAGFDSYSMSCWEAASTCLFSFVMHLHQLSSIRYLDSKSLFIHILLIFQNIFRSHCIHRSQYLPIRSQLSHFFPGKPDAIIPPRWRQHGAAPASEQLKTFILRLFTGVPFNHLIRRLPLWTKPRKNRSSSPLPLTAHCWSTSIVK